MGPDASLTPELIQAQSFTTAFRGYDNGEVRTFLTRVATEVRAWKERAEGLESAWHSAEERAARPPVLDEDTLMAAVGEETAAILRTARAAAADMRVKAGEDSERTLSEARAEAEQTLTEARSEAERALSEARTAAERMQQEAETALSAATAAADEQASALLAAARHEAAVVLQRAVGEAEDARAQAEKERQLTIEGANNTRDRILEDLSRRRRVATVQIEQLRAGRERLIESYAVVRRTLEEVQSELSRADAEARAAADDVGRRLRDEREVELSEASREFTEPVRPAAGEAVAHEEPEAAEAPPADGSAAQAAAAEPATDEPATAEPVAEAPDLPAADSSADSPSADQPALEADLDLSGLAGPGSAVDELFARIRATRADTPGEASPSATGETPPAGTGPAEPTSEQAAVDPPTESASALEPAGPEPSAPATAQSAEVETTSAETSDADATIESAQPQPGASAGTPAPARRASKKRSGPASANGRHPAPSGPTAKSSAAIGTGRARPTVRVIEPEAATRAGADAPAGQTAETADTGSAGSEDGEAPVPDGDEALMQAREFAVVDLEVNLTRRLKRALQDEQNDVLDRLRNLKGAITAAALLPDEKAQITRYAGAARPLLTEAAAAGALFTDETLGLPGRDAPVEVDISDLADECGTGIVEPLRRRMEQAIETGGGDDQAVLVESLGAAYREWKTQRIERLAGDVLSAAFSRGTWKAAPGGARLRWVVEDVDGPCPDCDDDALAGDIPKGEEFPTGQQHPPAHSGCRCLLVPSLAAD